MPLDILVVDDNALNAKLLRMAFESRGHRVRVAQHAQQALALVREAIPHTALLDVQMPDIDGLTLLRMFREEFPVHFPAVVVSAFAAGEDLDRAYQAGAAAFVPKPVNVKQLLSLVERLATADDGGTGLPVHARAASPLS